MQERQTGCYQSSRRHEYRWLPPPCSFLPSAGTQHCSTSSHPLSHMIFGTGAAGSPKPDRIQRWRRLGYAFKAPHGHGSPSPSLKLQTALGVTLVWPLVIIVVLISRVLKAHSFSGAKRTLHGNSAAVGGTGRRSHPNPHVCRSNSSPERSDPPSRSTLCTKDDRRIRPRTVPACLLTLSRVKLLQNPTRQELDTPCFLILLIISSHWLLFPPASVTLPSIETHPDLLLHDSRPV